MLQVMLAALTLAVVGPQQPAESSSDWLVDDPQKLELMVAKLEDGKLCGGFLRVDKGKRSLAFTAAPGEMGCKKIAEASAADVRAVKHGDGAGFIVELASGREKRLQLIPLPHAAWLLAAPSVKGGAVQQQLDSIGVHDRDGESIHAGGASGGGPRTAKAVEVPANVAADTKRAAQAVLAALGR